MIKTILKYSIVALGILQAQVLKSQDPNFHIYLCFGQSNMEGQGAIEAQDQSVDSRFRILQAVNCTGKPQETWRTATPPLSRCNTKLGPADYFGREMIKNLPVNVKVGIVHVAVAGCKIELFDKNNYATYLASAEQFVKDISSAYGNNPYARLVQLAKLAQKDGVIKGILMHQGESNSGDQTWPGKVKGVYDNLIKDLNLTASNVPLLAGQVVDAAQGGICAGHNAIIDKLPNTIPTAHVISSNGCTDESDNLHFNAAGYRLLGIRYAQKMLTLLGPLEETAPTITSDLRNTTIAQNQTLTLTVVATGSDLSYTWYRNNQIITGANTATLTINNVEASYDNSTFKVLVSNSLGSVTSNIITLTVTDFVGVKILKTSTPINIDGIKDDVWALSNEVSLKNKILTVDNDADLSGTVNVLYDNQALYVLYTVTDNMKRAASANFWENDGVEVYVDGNNDKATAYDANDFQFVFSHDAAQIQEGHSKSVSGITSKATSSSTGYVLEASIPWTLVGVTPTSNKSVGIDFHINDSDLSLRDGKMTWFATQDDSYSNPSSFGVGRLEAALITSVAGDAQQEQITLYPNPSKDQMLVQGVSGEFTYRIMDPTGRVLQSGGSSHSMIDIQQLASGIYGIWLEAGARKSFLTFVKE
ncbi:MAG TPA: sugar-binding protein [Cytophagales bacterium]|nr:sugar-binding protein [Cytophagales bacterium]